MEELMRELEPFLKDGADRYWVEVIVRKHAERSYEQGAREGRKEARGLRP